MTSPPRKNTVIVICGPTAIGKTSFAVSLAHQLQTEIISADSRQCYKELSIGVAKPSPEQLRSVHHYFINSHSIHDDVNAAVFTNYALNAVDDIFNKSNVAIMVGGTGLYIKAFCEGLDNIPVIEGAVRQQVMDMFEKKGITYLQDQLVEKDPAFWQQAEQQNPQRLMRALEVLLSTGRSITDYQIGGKEERNFNIYKVGLRLPKEELYNNINRRVDTMIATGLVEEVKSLEPYKRLNALQTVGYTEIFEHFQQKLTLQEAIERIKINTRHYAKRQLTWFKKDKDIHWLETGEKSNGEYVLNLL